MVWNGFQFCVYGVKINVILLAQPSLYCVHRYLKALASSLLQLVFGFTFFLPVHISDLEVC